MTTRIRSATAADAPFLAWVMLTASRSHVSRGAWDLYVDGPDARVLAFLERLATQPEPSFCRWRNFLVADVDGAPAAALSGYLPRDPGMLDPEPAIAVAGRVALGWDPPAMRAADARVASFLTCISAPAPDAWAVEWVATRPEFRRRGLVHELLLVILDAGRARRLTRSEIMVFIGNSPAQGAYERAGYRVVDEKRHADFARAVGCPGIARMTREL
ncbi:MAG: GNAT family N-acetyltransferase [Candidatus Binatia bacterium]